MSDLLRCPFCESQIPKEALYCSRCGGKIPRAQGTAPGIAPRMPTPVPGAAPAPADPHPAADASAAAGSTGPADAPRGATGAGTTPAATGGPARSAMSMSSASQSLSISRIQRPARTLRVVLLALVAGACIAGGYWLGRSGRPEPIAAVSAPPVVELGQPRVAVGADLPDPTRFLDPTADGGAAPEAPRGTGGARGRTGEANPTRPAPAGQGQAAGGASTPAPAGGGAAGGGGGTTAPDPAPAPAAGGGGAGGNAAAPAAGEPDPEPEPDDSGQLDTRAVIYVVRHYLPQVRACYERQLRNEPGLGGQITMRFTVGTAGRVTNTSVVVNSTGSDALAACVASNLRTWHFPVPEGGPVAFEYPFRFGSPAATPQFPGATQDP